jgi:hypothetical protein
MRNHRLHTRPGPVTRRTPRLRLDLDEPDEANRLTPSVPLLVEGIGDGISRPSSPVSRT